MPNKNHSIVDAAITSRKSVRAFRNDPVPLELVCNILEVASRAPSAANMQPWRVNVLTGATRQRVVDAVCHAYDHEPGQHKGEFQYYPNEFFEPYLSRRRKLGLAMYSLLGIKREEKERMRLQQRSNFDFFGAPVGLIFTINRNLPAGSFLDYGAFMQNIMISARGHGLDTCAQGVWSDYHRIISRELQLGAEEMLLGGMALGYADSDAPVNQLHTDRAPLSEFVTLHKD